MSEEPKGLPGRKKNGPRLDRPWRVVLYNDDVHNFEDVVRQIRKATDSSLLKAMEITYLAHNEGQSVVFEGSFVECQSVADVMREIGLMVQIFG